MIVVLIRTQLRSDIAMPTYEQLNARMFELAQRIPGFVSARAYRSDDGDEISLIRFASAEALRAWREHPEHRATQVRGREEFYAAYDIEVCEVVRAYDFGRAAPGTRTSDP
ncbi:MAG TPA: antibiotic biosynthesis monooxygenase [Kofleriaceae bacterium]